MDREPVSISVVVPLYEKADTVGQTLASALAQTWADFEIIVVDDGSTDGGADLVAGLGDPRVRILRQANQGVSAARNRGAMEARGTWIIFLDADDHCETGHLAQLAAAAEYDDSIVVFSNYVLRSLGRPVFPATLPPQRITDLFAFALTHYGYPLSPSATLVQRSAFFDAGMFPVGVPVGEDTDLWCRLALRGAFRYVAAPSAIYRDGLPSSALDRHLRAAPIAPPFAGTFARLIRENAVPHHLRRNARRYVNFLMLEFARQLLDGGRSSQARRVLLQHCTPLWDPLRYGKRLLRTWSLGHLMYARARRSSRAV